MRYNYSWDDDGYFTVFDQTKTGAKSILMTWEGMQDSDQEQIIIHVVSALNLVEIAAALHPDGNPIEIIKEAQRIKNNEKENPRR